MACTWINSGGRNNSMSQWKLKKRKRNGILCMICQKTVSFDRNGDDSSQLFTGTEKDCFKLLLRMLQISTEPFVFSSEWSEDEFTFCMVCGGFVKRGLLLIEEMKMLKAQLESVRTAVIRVLHVEAQKPANKQQEDSMKARIMLKQCYNPCTVSVDADLRLTADRALTVTREKLIAEEDLSVHISNVRSESEQYRSLQLKARKMYSDVLSDSQHDNDGVSETASISVAPIISGLEDAEDYDPFTEYCGYHVPEEENQGDDDTLAEKKRITKSKLQKSSEASLVETVTRRSLPPRRAKVTKMSKGVASRDINNLDSPEIGISRFCSICNESFNSQRALAKHYWGQHQNLSTPKLEQQPSNRSEDIDEYIPESPEEKSDSDWEVSRRRVQNVSKKRASMRRKMWTSPASLKTAIPGKPRLVTRKSKKKSPYRVWRDPKVLCLMQLECPFCQQTFQADKFSMHVNEVHGLLNSFDVYLCGKCGDVYDDETCDISNFQKKHKDCGITADALKCKICTVTLESLELKLCHHRYYHPQSRSCNICKVTFVTYSSVLRHQNKTYEFLKNKDAVGNDQISEIAAPAFGKRCELCGEFRPSIESYISHLRGHGFDYRMSCIICGKCGKLENRDEQSNFGDFFETHSSCEAVDSALLKCYECGTLTRGVNRTIEHYNHVHVKQPAVECELCKSSFTSLLRLRSHEISFHHLGLVIYENATMSSGFQTRKVSDKYLKRYECSSCRQCFRSEVHLVKHLKTHNFDDLEADAKELIEKYSKITLEAKGRSQKLKSRRRSVRTGIRPSSEDSSDDTYDSEIRNIGFQVDRNGHLEIEGQCPFCEEKFENKALVEYEKHVLESHKLTYYTGLYGCRNCGDVYWKTKAPSLRLFGQIHLTCKKTDRAEFDCPACNWKGKNFLHKIRHFKSRHYYPDLKCDICDKEFTRIGCINQHRKEAHDIPLPSELRMQSNRKDSSHKWEDNYPLTPNFVGDNDMDCAICKERFDTLTRELLPHHVAISHKISYFGSVYGCAGCCELYNNNMEQCSITQFMEKHASCPPLTADALLFNCRACNGCMSTFEDLVIHTKQEHARKNIWCYLCGKQLSSLKNLRIHHVKVHDENKTVGLEDPSTIIEEENEISQPLFIGPTPDKEDYVCGICDEIFSYDDCKLYKGHMRSVHNLRSLFGLHACRTCGDVFQEKDGFSMKDFGANHYKCHRPENGELKCKDCGKLFKNLAARCRHFLRDHYKIKAAYNCRLCGSPFKFYSLLRMHMWNSHRERLPDIKERIYRKTLQTNNPVPEHNSGRFGRTSGSKLGPLKHMAKTPPEIISCKFCPRSYKIFQSRLLKDHVKEIHGLTYTFNQGNDVYGCEKCGILCLDTEKDVVEEFASKHNAECVPVEDPLFICPICKRSEKSYKELDRHYRVFHTHRAFDCPLCDKTFPHNYLLVNHVRSSHNEEVAISGTSRNPNTALSLAGVSLERVLPTKCVLCPAELTERMRGLHYSTEHCLVVSGGYYGCYNCHEIYSVKPDQSLAEYVEIHKRCLPPSQRGNYKCKICSKEFKTFCHLTCHHARMHLKVQYCCDECGKIFKSETCFRDHLIMHKNPSLYKCPDCPKKFRSFRNLKSHMDSKIKDTSVICEVCGGKFVSELTLKRHLLTHEERVRNVKCELCDKMFWNRLNMSSHIREFHRKARKDRWQKAKAKRNQQLEEEAQAAESAPVVNCDELL